MKSSLAAGAVLISTVAGLAAFAVVAPLSPIADENGRDAATNVVVQLGTPVVRAAPKPDPMRPADQLPTLGALGRAGVVAVAAPVRDASVQITSSMQAVAAQARRLGIVAAPAGNGPVAGAAGQAPLVLRLDPHATRAVAAAALPSDVLTRVAAALDEVVAADGRSSRVTTTLALGS